MAKISKDIKVNGLPQWLSGKDSAWNTGDAGVIPGLGRFPGGGNGNPLQYSCQKISRTEEPGGLQFPVLQRVRYD